MSQVEEVRNQILEINRQLRGLLQGVAAASNNIQSVTLPMARRTFQGSTNYQAVQALSNLEHTAQILNESVNSMRLCIELFGDYRDILG